MHAHSVEKPDESATLTKALLNAGKALGLTQDDLGKVVGRDRTAFHRAGIDPRSKSGELALLLVRLYRSLYVLVGGKAGDLKHWMQTENRHTGGVPADQIKSVPGLIRIVEYLDAMRGKI
ncbi:MAG: MbcA/ParS/Xre antitoxin family protein [Candidatus Thiodiazotropha sp. (ex Monitilora ramsayi)]|nr:MbcA/ParS/Xre antitoxin family protein [Candidatus Thiodiazotropha sp. (ex Monitilora ramsayi)]